MSAVPPLLRSLLRPNGRSLVLAMDHALVHGPIAGLEQPGQLISAMIDAGADAIMTSYGVVKKYGHLMRDRIPFIMRIDGGPSVRSGAWREYDDYRLLFSVEDAVAQGASAVVVMHFMGAPAEMDTLANLATAAAECARAGVPLLVEALPCPHPNIPNIFDPEVIALAARIAAELGADMVKTTYSGDVASFRRIVDTATVPLLVLGGERMNSTHDVLTLTHGSVAAGGAGVVMGRNIWQANNPAAMVRALAAIIHDGATAEAAEALLA